MDWSGLWPVLIGEDLHHLCQPRHALFQDPITKIFGDRPGIRGKCALSDFESPDELRVVRGGIVVLHTWLALPFETHRLYPSRSLMALHNSICSHASGVRHQWASHWVFSLPSCRKRLRAWPNSTSNFSIQPASVKLHRQSGSVQLTLRSCFPIEGP